MLKNTIFRRTFILFSVIVLVYTLLIVISLTYKNHQMMILKNDNLNQLYVEENSKNIDFKLHLALTYLNRLENTESLNTYLNNPYSPYLTTEVYNELKQNFNSPTELGFIVGITKFTDDYIVSSLGTTSYNKYLQLVQVDDSKMKTLPEMFDSLKGEVYFAKNSASGNRITLAKRYLTTNGSDSLFLILSFDKTALMPDTLPNNLGNFIIKADQTDLKLLADYPNVTNKAQLYQIKSSVLNNINYSYVINEADYKKLNRSFLSSLWLNFIPLAILGISIIILGTKRSYLPIDTLLTSLKLNQSKTTKHANELTTIMQSFETINEINQQFEQDYQKQFSLRQEMFMKNYLFDVPMDLQTDYQKEYASLAAFHEGGILCLLKLGGIAKQESNLSEQSLLSLRSFLINSFNQQLGEQFFLLVSIDYQTFFLLFNEKNPRAVVATLQKIIDQVETEFDLDLIFSVSNQVDSFTDFSSAYKEAYSLLGNCHLAPELKIITSESTQHLRRFSYIYSFETEQKLLAAFTNHDWVKANLILTTILEANLIKIKLDTYNLERFKYALLNTLKRLLNQQDKSLVTFSKEHEQAMNQINQADLSDVYNGFITLFKQTLVLQDQEYGSSNALVNSIMSYLDEHYLEDLSLTDLADYFNLTEGYISKLLKEHTQESFKNYLNSLKVKKAKELLLTTNYKVSQVSTMVGCNNVNTFIRMFKRHVGISPGEFMRSAT